MRRVPWMVLWAGVSIGPATGVGAEPGDLEKLEGTWAFTSIKSEGRSVPRENVEEIRLVIEGTKYKQTKLGAIMEDGTIQVDPTKAPGWITLTIASGPSKGETQVGIYRIDGETLTLCMAAIGSKERPTEFVSRGTSKDLLFGLKRGQP